jgi:hypothetical protein
MNIRFAKVKKLAGLAAMATLVATPFSSSPILVIIGN